MQRYYKLWNKRQEQDTKIKEGYSLFKYDYKINLNVSTYLTAINVDQAEILKKIRNNGVNNYYNSLFRGNLLT